MNSDPASCRTSHKPCNMHGPYAWDNALGGSILAFQENDTQSLVETLRRG